MFQATQLVFGSKNFLWVELYQNFLWVELYQNFLWVELYRNYPAQSPKLHRHLPESQIHRKQFP